LNLIEKINVKAIAHITGGGIPGNLIRVIPEGLKAVIEEGSWEILPVFKWIEKEGKVPKEEMYKTFNMGLGMILSVSKKDEAKAIEILESSGEKPYLVGYIEKGEKSVNIL
jgi:phosphoribosylformylglycinamidine cyclo-ligase